MQGQIVKATQEWASLLTNLQWQKVMKVAPKWLSLLMVILVAKSAADLTWLMFTPNARGGGLFRQSIIHSRPQPAVRLRTVSDLHLFGVANKAPAQAPIEAKKTHLKLILRGVFASNDPANEMAIIANERGQEKVYRKGDTIFSGVKLYAVYPTKVILERSGNFESLSLPRNENDEAMKGVRIIHPPGENSMELNRNLPVVTRTVQGGSMLRGLRQQILQKPQLFWKNVRIEPRYGSNNQILGYTFAYDNPQIMNAMGLRPNDIIVSVNGQPVTDPSVLSSLMGKLSTATSFSLGILRNGQRENLNISM